MVVFADDIMFLKPNSKAESKPVSVASGVPSASRISRDLPRPALANQQHDLPHSLGRVFPAVPQDAQFRVAANERRQVFRCDQVESVSRFAFAGDEEHFDRFGNAADLVSAVTLAVEETSHDFL